MAILFVGNTGADVGGQPSIAVNATGRDAAYSPNSVSVVGPQGSSAGSPEMFVIEYLPPAGDTIWFHCRMAMTGSPGGTLADGYLFRFKNANHQYVAAYELNNGNTIAQVLGDTTVNSAEGTPTLSVTTFTLDLRLTVNNTNIILDIYINGTLSATATAANNVGLKIMPYQILAEINGVGSGGSSGSRFWFTEMVVADVDTRGWRVACLEPNTTGTYTDWAGAITDIQGHDTASGIVSNTANQRFSYNPTAYGGAATPTEIVAVVSKVSSSNVGGAPSKLKHFLRIGGTDYESAQFNPATTPRNMAVWETNPATASPWVVADLSTFQTGFKSET